MTKENNKITDISNYDELIAYLDERKRKLEARKEKSYKGRYFLRRLPVFSSIGLVFFTTCILFTFFEQLGYQKIDAFLLSLNLLDGTLAYIFCILSGLGILLLIFHFGEYEEKIINQNKCERIKKVLKWLPSFKISAKFVLFLAPLAVFFAVLNTEYPLLLGVAFFSAATLGTMLLERTLGYTRRNERCYYFAKRAENLSQLLTFKQKMEVVFDEKLILEVYQLNEDFQRSRYEDTVNDTQYLSQQMERIKVGKNFLR